MNKFLQNTGRHTHTYVQFIEDNLERIGGRFISFCLFDFHSLLERAFWKDQRYILSAYYVLNTTLKYIQTKNMKQN